MTRAELVAELATIERAIERSLADCFERIIVDEDGRVLSRIITRGSAVGHIRFIHRLVAPKKERN